MLERLKTQALQISLVLCVFLLFIANATGLLEFTLKAGPQLSFNSTLLNSDANQQITHSPLFRSCEFYILLITGMLLSILLPVLSPIKASLLTAVAMLAPFYAAYSQPASKSLLPIEYSFLTILMLFAVNVLISYFRETMSKQKIVDVFGQYVPPQLVSEISRHPEQVSLDGEAKNLTVFFCDLQDFSGVAEQLNPKQLAHLLNEYFTAMTEVLYRHGATIDKYIGDSIMAFWGAPIAQADHATRAARATFELHTQIRNLSESFVKRGWPGPKMGIGINTGIMNVGNMGSKYRVAYTVVGDAVNLASRLESLTRTYKVPSIVSESTKTESQGILYRELDLVQVKGKHNKTKIYQPICLENNADEEMRRFLKRHQAAMDEYFSENWQSAEKLFQSLRSDYREDKFYKVMLNKISKK